MPPFLFRSTVKHFPDLPYEQIKNDILGTHYQLSLLLVGTKRATVINQQSRNKTYAPNVLSFPYDSHCGEIVMCPRIAAREAYPYGMTKDGYFGFLYIHGLLHLQGHDHGDVMERLEKKYVKKYQLS
jgi:probable rRNA maturation factor